MRTVLDLLWKLLDLTATTVLELSSPQRETVH